MRKLSNITESMWGDIHRRNSGEIIRKEDDQFHFMEDFKKIEQMDLIHPVEKVDGVIDVFTTSDYLWTPCNFGAENYMQPGRYFTCEEIVALNDFLKKTDYEIACLGAFKSLTFKPYEYKKVGKFWTYIFGSDENKVYIPAFGIMSGPPLNIHINHKKNDVIVYGCIHKGDAGILGLDKYDQKLYLSENGMSHHCTQGFQIRLVKKLNK